MAAQWGQFLASIDPTAGEYRRQQAHTQDMKTARLQEAITGMKIEEAQREIERRDRFQSSLKDIGDTYLRQPVETVNRDTAIKDQVYQGLLERGMPPHVAEGFMMNFADESGFDPSITERVPNVHGTRGKGLYQLTGPRRQAYESMYGNDYSVDNQLDFLMQELQGPESRAAEAIYAAQTPGEAGAAIVNKFLRPAAEHAQARTARYTGASEEDAQVAERLVNERGFPPQLVEAGQAAFNNPGANNVEAATNNMLMLMTEFPEYAGDLAPIIEGMQGLRDSDMRKAKDKLQKEIVKKIEAGGVFDEDMEERLIGLSVLSGDISPSLDYFKEKRQAEGKATTAQVGKFDKPSDVLSQVDMTTLATLIDQDPTQFGLTQKEWDKMEKGGQQVFVQELMSATVEDVVNRQPGKEGWPRHLSPYLEFKRYAQTLGAQEEEPQAPVQQEIAPGTVVDWSSL